MSGSRISTLVFSAGNVFIAFALIALVYMTRRDMPKVDEYDDYSLESFKTVNKIFHIYGGGITFF